MSELNEQLLDIARRTGLRGYLHGVNATDARELLGAFVAEMDKQRATPAPQAAPSDTAMMLQQLKGIATSTKRGVGARIADIIELIGKFEARTAATGSQAAPSEPVARANDDQLRQRENDIWKVFVAMQDGLSRNGFQGAVDAGLAAQQSPADARELFKHTGGTVYEKLGELSVKVGNTGWWLGCVRYRSVDTGKECVTDAERWRSSFTAIAAATTSTERMCPKLESLCGDDSWGWCQACPKRTSTEGR
jgi:hypothetical protein